MEVSGDGISELSGGDAVGQMRDQFECPQCYEMMLERECVQTDCGHTFCLACLVSWQKTCHTKGVPFSCPSCRVVVKHYEPFHWPQRLIRNMFEVGKQLEDQLRTHKSRVQLLEQQQASEAARWSGERAAFEEQLRAIERERNTLRDDRARVQLQVDRDAAAQAELQNVLNEFRAQQEVALRTKDAEMARLRTDIAAMERKQEDPAELVAARQRMRDLELERTMRNEREAAMREQLARMEATLAEHRTVLAAKDAEMAELAARKNRILDSGSAEGFTHVPDETADDATTSPLYESLATGGKWVRSVLSSPLVTGSVVQGGRAVRYVTKLLRDSVLTSGKHPVLVQKEDDYALLERRGSHFASPVWRAVMRSKHAPQQQQEGEDDQALPVEVAVKMRADSSDAHREVMLLHKLCHPNIVALLGVYHASSTGRLALLMPFLEADLEWWLSSENAAVVVRERDNVAFQLLSAVTYAHAHDVVHRSISPGAVFLTPAHDGSIHLRLASWTNAVSLASPVLPRLLERCTRYRAPEQLMLEHDAISNWKAVDAWATGAVLWELVTAERNEYVPIISEGSQNGAVLMRALLSWRELRDAAAAAAPSALVAAVLSQEVTVTSLVDRLDAALASDSWRELLLRLLSWVPAARGTLADALMHPMFAVHRSDAVPGSYVEDLRTLSDYALAEFVKAHLSGE